ncbi:GuaB3 family IMP dehydrogenase-related protein [Nakamurella antarctica]|uniref:GuaB3 family IMP dehydrogenase-related protein n=1 Tax=Nakamurella antarctica TaxID=1902245 RepID=A0A3G8ZW15_9ACTN|nr:GuaB3 family IMP dehydrogenase-related protein [Nakamurella antarctica]AZI58644.1 GuaB3 family IMP dehydrogenase-related protein [Nakamurella antarctica]
MADSIEIGMGRSARRTFTLDDVSLVPSRRTRSSGDVSTSWQIDAYRFGIPMLTHPTDAVSSPSVIAEVGRLGGLGVLDAEGLWARHADPAAQIAQILDGAKEEESEGVIDGSVAKLQELYSAPIDPDLLAEVIRGMKSTGNTVAVRVSPQHAAAMTPLVVAAGIDMLVIQGTIVSAQHVQDGGEGLNLKNFIAGLDVPVIVGACTNYQTATHLMRTGAAGVIVGYGAGSTTTTDSVLGIHVPMATAIADAAAARRSYLDETGGRYVHVIADGDMATSGDVVKAIACGADAVMLGEQLTAADSVPGEGFYWVSAAAHPRLPRGHVGFCGSNDVSLETLLTGPASGTLGDTNIFGALSRAMAKTGYCDLKDFQKVGLTVRG